MNYRQETWVDRISSPENIENYPSDAGAEVTAYNDAGAETGVYKTIRVEHDIGPDVQIEIQVSLDRVDWVNKTPEFISGNGKIGKSSKTGRGILVLEYNRYPFIRIRAEVTGRATSRINDFAEMLPRVLIDNTTAMSDVVVTRIISGMSDALVKRYGYDDTHIVLNVVCTD